MERLRYRESEDDLSRAEYLLGEQYNHQEIIELLKNLSADEVKRLLDDLEDRLKDKVENDKVAIRRGWLAEINRRNSG